jgi:hypothetical protein
MTMALSAVNQWTVVSGAIVDDVSVIAGVVVDGVVELSSVFLVQLTMASDIVRASTATIINAKNFRIPLHLLSCRRSGDLPVRDAQSAGLIRKKHHSKAVSRPNPTAP